MRLRYAHAKIETAMSSVVSMLLRLWLLHTRNNANDYLKRCFNQDVKLHKVYRYMDTLYNTQREKIQYISVAHTRGLFGGQIGIVFYDVTTGYNLYSAGA